MQHEGSSRFQQKTISTTRKPDEEAKDKAAKDTLTNDVPSSRIGMKFFNFLPDIHEFCWDVDNSSKEINFSSDGRHAFLHETNYLFRTMISNRPFMDG